MITDQDVSDLYRCLLNRAPESAGTIAAFKSYYPDFARGRSAILQSAEFARLAETECGSVAPRLARALLRRAAGDASLGTPNSHPELRGAMQIVLRAHGNIRLAVVVGDGSEPIQDVLPLDSSNAVVLHIAPGAPPGLPLTADLPQGGVLFRIAFEPPELVALLVEAGLLIDVLAVFGNQPGWFTTLQPCMAGHAILLADTSLPDGIDTWPNIERPLQIGGMTIRFCGGWFLPVTYVPAGIPEDEAAVPGLCLAAIMRNEEAAAPNMLASAAPVADSFVVVDTGSTDETVARVKTCLSNIGKPFIVDTTSPGRFDDMRNAALALVPPSASWVLMLDADEELGPEDREALRGLLRNADRDAFALPRYNYTGADKSGEVTPYPDRQVRLFRNRPADPVRYSGAVHETVRGVDIGRLPLDATAIDQGRGGPHIHHLVRRFRSPEAEARKQDHYRAIAARFAEADAAPG